MLPYCVPFLNYSVGVHFFLGNVFVVRIEIVSVINVAINYFGCVLQMTQYQYAGCALESFPRMDEPLFFPKVLMLKGN